jgi:adenylate kinase family enzyme
MILDLFIYIIQFYINQNTFLPGFIIRKEYEFVFSPDKEKEIISKSEQLTNKNEVVTFERIWNVNDKNELVLTKNVKKFQKQSKPVIHYLRKKNKVQIWTEDTIEYVLVNGKKINIKKDVLGHDFIELSLKKHKTNIDPSLKFKCDATDFFKRG